MFETMYAAPGHRARRDPGRRPQRRAGASTSARIADQPLGLHQPGDHRARGQRRGARKAACPCPASSTTVDARRARITRPRARSRRPALRARRRRPARGLHPARDGPPRRQAVRRLPVRAQAHAHPQEAREGAPRPRAARRARTRRRQLIAERLRAGSSDCIRLSAEHCASYSPARRSSPCRRSTRCCMPRPRASVAVY